MARIKYYYDTESCKYERIKVSTWDIILNLLGFFSVSFIISVIIVVLFSTYFESPKEMLLKKENQELKIYYDLLEKELGNLNSMMAALQKRDDNVYRVIFEADPIPESIRQAGTGGSERYKEILESDLVNEEMIIQAIGKVDKIKRQMYIQTKSYDEILQMARNKSKLLAATPAIQPIANRELTRLASGFGMRIHPIYKVKMMHFGVDFTAPRHTPIYATGDGVVERVIRNFGGYGKQVIINHGFGYKTRYAHMQDFNVKKGDRVKRGDLIGTVGNSGLSTAPHLHYEIIKDKKKVNPVNYFYMDLNDEEYEKILELASIENQSLS
jgi:murein DD-endopeptidase MepM/ murein hydrolase activator NlpD